MAELIVGGLSTWWLAEVNEDGGRTNEVDAVMKEAHEMLAEAFRPVAEALAKVPTSVPPQKKEHFWRGVYR